MPIVRPTLSYLRERGVRDGSSPRKTLSQSETSFTKRYFVSWSDRYNVVKYFLGDVRISYDGSIPPEPVRLERLVPLLFPGEEFAYASRISVLNNHKITGKESTAFDGAVSAIYDQVEIEVTFEKPKYRILTDASVGADEEFLRYVQFPIMPDMTGQYVQIPSGGLTYVAQGGADPPTDHKVPFQAGMIEPQMKMQFTWMDLPPDILDYYSTIGPLPWWDRMIGTDSERSYIGTINKTEIFRIPPGKGLLMSVKPMMRSSPVDSSDWDIGARYDIQFEFEICPIPGGWNALYFNDVAGFASDYYYVARGGSTTYQAPGTVGDNESLYCEREFRDLFKVQA